MWKTISILVLSLNIASTTLRINAKAVANPEIYGDFKLNTNQDFMNVTMNVKRVLGGKIMWKFTLYRLTSNGLRQKYLSIPKVNYCYIRRNSKFLPVMSTMMEHLKRYGNWSARCPYKVGFYGLWNVPLDDHFLPMKNIIPKGRYEAANDLIDENQKIEMIVKFSFFIDIL